MVEFLDLGLLQYFVPILLFVIVWAVLYSLLQNKKYISENESINAIIAFVASLLLISQYQAVLFLGTLLPIFLFMAVIIVFFLLIFSFIGWDNANLNQTVANNKVITWVIVVLGFLITVYAAGQIFGQQLLEAGEGTSPIEKQVTVDNSREIERNAQSTTAGGDFGSNIVNTLFNPKVLGMMLIMIIGALVIVMLSMPEGK